MSLMPPSAGWHSQPLRTGFDFAQGERMYFHTPNLKRCCAIGLILLLLCLGTAAQAQTFPKITGLVVDAANVLPPQVEADLTTKLQALQKDTNRQLVVATIPDLQGYPVEDYGYRLGRAWGVGLKDVNNGTILLIAPQDRKVRIEVGYGLEGVLTDALSNTIIQQQMLPKLREKDYGAAATAGTDAIVAQLRASPDEAKARTDAAVADFDRTHRQTRSSGGGIPIGLIFGGVILAFVVVPMLVRGRRGGGRAYGGGGDGGGVLPIVLWSVADAMMRGGGGSGGSSWGGGGSSGGSDGGWGGGGFSGGGGGSFGGGGASGDW